MTSKLVLLMGTILFHMQIATKVIQIIHLLMKLCMKMDLNTTLQLWKKNAQLVKQKTCDNVNHYDIYPGPDVKPHRVINDTW